jgi:Ca2+-binding RTX toxin-like protein
MNGNSGNNVIDGGLGDDKIQGFAGDDILKGGTGNDWVLYTDATAAVTVDLAVLTAQDNSAAGVGKDTLTGFEHLQGGNFNDVLKGNTLANIIDGGAGNDAMSGGAGNDTYYVDASGDTVVEGVNFGTDTVISQVAFTLGANVENLTLTGATDINGAGNDLNNVLIGNTGKNALTGGIGNDTLDGGTKVVSGQTTDDGAVDTLTGGTGNDIYIVGSGDTIAENASEGTDTAKAYSSFTLSANVENLELLGVGHINGTGNALANKITGNAGNNILDGGAGDAAVDVLIGGKGDDTYIVEVGDTVTELALGGTDTVKTSLSTYTLGANVENLTLTGTGDNTGIGNTLANVITGNSGDNTLTGGLGNDTFVFNTALDAATNVDTITDFTVVNDTIKLDNDIFTALAAGTLNSNALVKGAGVTSATDVNHRIIYNSTDGKLYYDADGIGAEAAVEFANIGSGKLVTNLDFNVF